MSPLKLLVALALSVSPLAANAAVPANVTGAVTLKSRSADNVKLDEGRKPAELLRFFGLEQGMSVLDVGGANRYWAEIFAPAIGATGKVHVWQPAQFYEESARKAFADFAARTPNASISASPFEAPDFAPDSADFVLINMDYHDVYWESTQYKIPRMDPQAWLRKLHAAVKPGGVVGIVDHVAATGAPPRESVDKAHRIDPAVVRADFERAGFVFEGESAMYRNPADDHSLLVFDPKIRGKTDRFVYKFRKPR